MNILRVKNKYDVIIVVVSGRPLPLGEPFDRRVVREYIYIQMQLYIVVVCSGSNSNVLPPAITVTKNNKKKTHYDKSSFGFLVGKKNKYRVLASSSHHLGRSKVFFYRYRLIRSTQSEQMNSTTYNRVLWTMLVVREISDRPDFHRQCRRNSLFWIRFSSGKQKNNRQRSTSRVNFFKYLENLVGCVEKIV